MGAPWNQRIFLNEIGTNITVFLIVEQTKIIITDWKFEIKFAILEK